MTTALALITIAAVGAVGLYLVDILARRLDHEEYPTVWAEWRAERAAKAADAVRADVLARVADVLAAGYLVAVGDALIADYHAGTAADDGAADYANGAASGYATAAAHLAREMGFRMDYTAARNTREITGPLAVGDVLHGESGEYVTDADGYNCGPVTITAVQDCPLIDGMAAYTASGYTADGTAWAQTFPYASLACLVVTRHEAATARHAGFVMSSGFYVENGGAL